MGKQFEKTTEKIQTVGDAMVDLFHYFALFVIGGTIVWSAVHEYIHIMQQGHADLKDILLLFIYLELGAMVGIYFKTHRLPVQFLIYIAITALARHLVIDMQKVTEEFHIILIVAIVFAILILSVAIMVFAFSARRFGRPEDGMESEQRKPDF
ncbi:MAG: phosphate-starvation-inducible PsiE family protein [Gammaproteobacteria bacterium]|nr:phosphate-starvation-inducible PsiE family protein [Gammaproteobacteria bacterium]